MRENPALVAIDVVLALRQRGLPCAIGGAVAFGAWAVPRATKDADINVFVGEDRHVETLDALIAVGCSAIFDQPWTAELRAEWLRRAREGEVAVAWKDGFRVDVFVPSIPFYAEVEATLREVEVLGQRVPVISPEALAVFKLLFFRPKDLVDLQTLVKVQGSALDVAYVRRHMVHMVGEDDDRTREWDRLVREHDPR